MKSHYKVLGVSQTADDKAIKKAYRDLALKYHPDRAAANNITKEDCEKIFKKINEAYGTLIDPSKRKEYNKTLRFHPYGRNLKVTRNFFKSKREFQKSTTYKNHEFKKPEDFKFQSSQNNNSYPQTIYVKALSSTLLEIIRDDDYKKLDIHLKNEPQESNVLYSILFQACLKGKPSVAFYLIVGKKINPNVIFENGLSFSGHLFKAAAEGGHLALVKFLLEIHRLDIESQGTSPGTKDTALSRAARNGHLAIVEYLISKGANLNPEIAYSNLVRQGIVSGDVEVIKRLVEAGTKIDKYDLGYALEKGVLEIVKYILSKVPGLKFHEYWKSLACCAINSGNVDLVKYLEEKESMNIFEKYGNDEDITDSILAAAGKSNSIPMIKYLLADKKLLGVCQKSESYANTLLSNAVKGGLFEDSSIDRLALVKYLIEELRITLPKNHLIHIIHNDAQFKSIEMNAYLQSFLTNSIEVRQKLLKISRVGLQNIPVDQLFSLYYENLIKRGEDGNFRFEIHHCIKEKKILTKELEVLFVKCAIIRRNAIFYYTSYYYSNDLEVISLLLKLGADVNATNLQGEVVLSHAIHQGGYNNIVKLLIENGADVDAKNKFGMSCRDILQDDKKFQRQISELEYRKTKLSTDPISQSEQKCILSAKERTHIKFADKPLNQGGKPIITSVAEFQSYLGVPLSDSIYFDNGLKIEDIKFGENIRGFISSRLLCNQIKNLLSHPRDDLVVCKMGNVGLGIFSESNIPKDTVILIYGGEVTKGVTTTNSKDEALQFHGSAFIFATNKSRSLASLLQHLPEKSHFSNIKEFQSILEMSGQNLSESELKQNSELYSTEFFSADTKENVMTENLRLEYVNYNGIPLIAIVTNEDIKPGDQLGFNYGYEYWLSRKIIPEFFDKLGAIIPPACYIKTFGCLQFPGGFTYTGEYKPLIDAVKIGQQEITIVDDAKQTHKVAAKIVQQSLIAARAMNETKDLSIIIGSSFIYHDGSSEDQKHENLIRSFPSTFSVSQVTFLNKAPQKPKITDKELDILVYEFKETPSKFKR